MFVSKALNVIDITEYCHQNLELVAVDVVTDTAKFRLINIYRKALYTPEAALYAQELTDCLKLLSTVTWTVVITGDLNCPDIDWNSLTAPNDNVQDTVINFACDNSFEQLVQDATRGKNILDVVLTNNPFYVVDVQVSDQFSSSDHNRVEFLLDVSSANVDTTKTEHPTFSGMRKVYKWNEADFDAIGIYLAGVDWYQILSTNLNVDALWDCYKNVLYDAFDRFVPTCEVKNRPKRTRDYPSFIRKAMNKKQHLWRALKINPGNLSLKLKYSQAEIECRRLLKQHELYVEKKILEQDNLSGFYKYVNSKLGCSSGVATLRDKNGGTATDDETKANWLNQHFVSVCTDDNGNLPVFNRQVPDNAELSSVQFNSTVVVRVIKSIRSKLSVGPGGIPSLVLKKLGPRIADSLALLFQSFMSVGKVPTEWKSAIVLPLYKKGSASDCGNYRPVALTCPMC